MKKILIASLAGMLLFASCENEGSSTVGVYENDKPTSEENEGAANTENLKGKPQADPTKDSTAAADTLKTNMDAGSKKTDSTN